MRHLFLYLYISAELIFTEIFFYAKQCVAIVLNYSNALFFGIFQIPKGIVYLGQ